MNTRDLLAFYQQQLFEQVLPFWMEHGIDRQYGGYFTGFPTQGDRLLHRHKFVWAQGRFVWVLSRLMAQFSTTMPPSQMEATREAADAGARFLMQHALLPNGHCAWFLSRTGEPILLDREGNVQPPQPGDVYDTSIYSDCFVALGLAEYARLTRDRAAYDFALRLYDSIRQRLASGVFGHDPYPIPPGYKPHGIPLIMLDLTHQMIETCDSFGDALAADLRRAAQEYCDEIMNHFLQPDANVVIEFLGDDNQVRDTMLGTFINPGHSLEAMWMVMHWAAAVADKATISKAAAAILKTSDLGWDQEYGGFLLFIHKGGGPPRGAMPPELEATAMAEQLQTFWSQKNGWTQLEALYALLLAYDHTRRDEFLELYWKTHNYAFELFPQPEGDWAQWRERNGAPIENSWYAAKDCFHAPRTYMHIIRLLQKADWAMPA